MFSSSYSKRANGSIPLKCRNILLTSLFFLTSFLFPSLWNSHLTVAWGERGWHSRKVLLPSTPNCTISLRRFSTAQKETRETVTTAKEIPSISSAQSTKSLLTFGVEASALPQRVTVFDILSSAPPEEKDQSWGLSAHPRSCGDAVRTGDPSDLFVDGVKAEQLSPSQAQ